MVKRFPIKSTKTNHNTIDVAQRQTVIHDDKLKIYISRLALISKLHYNFGEFIKCRKISTAGSKYKKFSRDTSTRY